MLIDLLMLCLGLPECFLEYINYTRNLQFTEKPDYDYLRNIFIESAKKHNIELKYYWENSNILIHKKEKHIISNKRMKTTS